MKITNFKEVEEALETLEDCCDGLENDVDKNRQSITHVAQVLNKLVTKVAEMDTTAKIKKEHPKLPEKIKWQIDKIRFLHDIRKLIGFTTQRFVSLSEHKDCERLLPSVCALKKYTHLDNMRIPSDVCSTTVEVLKRPYKIYHSTSIGHDYNAIRLLKNKKDDVFTRTFYYYQSLSYTGDIAYVLRERILSLFHTYYNILWSQEENSFCNRKSLANDITNYIERLSNDFHKIEMLLNA